jgi:predicted nuclease of predicted toxin-antitoxin system
LRFLLDVHISNRIAAILRKNGHDVRRMVELSREMADYQILSLAISEQRILITEDSDFSELIFAEGASPPPALIYIRCRSFDQLKMPEAILATVSNDRLIGHIAVVTPDTLRFRPFPKVKTND